MDGVTICKFFPSVIVILPAKSPKFHIIYEDFGLNSVGTLTFKENALIKAKYVADDLHKIVLADDSGIEIDAFGKLPGIYSARFLGKDTPYPIINQAIIDAIEGKERTCRFVCALALCIPDQEPILIQETFEGEIHDHIAGVNGFGYDPIFYFPPCQKTSAEMTLEEKNKYSHRAKALKKLYTILKEL